MILGLGIAQTAYEDRIETVVVASELVWLVADKLVGKQVAEARTDYLEEPLVAVLVEQVAGIPVVDIRAVVARTD